MKFINRQQAGKLLAERLMGRPFQDPLVLALPRGGVPVALEISHSLGAPLEVLIVRKIGAPIFPEYGIGAVTEDGHFWLDPQAMHYARADASEVEEILAKEKAEVERRIIRYREGRPLPSLRGRSVIIVDDGLATGVTARVACHYVKQQGAKEVFLAVPVCSPRTGLKLDKQVDELICLHEPEDFRAVGEYYEEFHQLEDEEVISLLRKEKVSEISEDARSVSVNEGPVTLGGILTLPKGAKGIVLFAHGSGSSRFSPRNQQVARILNKAGLGTLLFDLLTPEESGELKNVFNISFLGSRLTLAIRWLKKQADWQPIPIGFFGASTGAGAALWAAAELGEEISAVVSRGGRPDLAGDRLTKVKAPTLLLVGSRDEPVIDMNWNALSRLKTGKLVIIPGATHLFEEEGTMEQVEEKAAEWFVECFLKGSQDAVA